VFISTGQRGVGRRRYQNQLGRVTQPCWKRTDARAGLAPIGGNHVAQDGEGQETFCQYMFRNAVSVEAGCLNWPYTPAGWSWLAHVLRKRPFLKRRNPPRPGLIHHPRGQVLWTG
jgi:hypothetical protein